MKKTNLLEGKRVLIVDDESDVLETLGELLSMCKVRKTTIFEKAEQLLRDEYFDMAILDIMGVDGYKLLEIAKKRKVIPVMLTAHALSTEDVIKSYEEGAALYVPKDKMKDISLFLNDVLEAREAGKGTWWRWYDRFASYFDKSFGPRWQEKDKNFWDKFTSYHI
ncbi:MAG TPA: response regulator [Desulfobacteraceae bacterium]|nr:response regulator [Desulfobacteraceae bacterium]